MYVNHEWTWLIDMLKRYPNNLVENCKNNEKKKMSQYALVFI